MFQAQEFIVYLQLQDRLIRYIFNMRYHITLYVFIQIFYSAFCWVNEQVYHNDTELQQETDMLAKQYANIFLKRSCYNDPEIHIIESKNKPNNQNSQKFHGIVVCNQHARQFITAQACLQFMKNIAQKQQIFNDLSLKIIYNANPISRQKSLQGDYCLRTNQNGIDVNRNFPYKFHPQEQHQSQTYPGIQPLSETYSKCLDHQAKDTLSKSNKQSITIYLGIHSGEFSIYFSKCNKTDQQNLQYLYKIRDICPPCRFRENKQSGGTSYQDMKCRMGFKYSNVFEIFGGYDSILPSQKNCWVIFNPTARPFYELYVKRASEMMETFFKQIINKQNKIQ